MPYVITLVHGTFSRDAPWVQQTSPLCQYIETQLSEPVIFQTFRWSGKNSSRARARAALELRDTLIASTTAHPSSHHYVIAHSHGGNIALRAVNATSLEDAIDGIICLATPFLHVSERWVTDASGNTDVNDDTVIMDTLMSYDRARRQFDFSPASPTLVFSRSVFIGLWLLLAIPFWILASQMEIYAFPAIFADSWSAVAQVNNYVVVLPTLLLAGIVLKRWVRLSRVVIEENTLITPIFDRVMIVRVSGDEASALLNVAQFFSWVLRRTFQIGQFATIWNHAESVFRASGALLETHAKRVGLATVALLCCWIVSLWLAATSASDGEYLLFAFLWFPLIGLLAFMPLFYGCIIESLVGLIALLAVALCSAFLLPFGVDLALCSIFIDVTAEGTPAGDWPMYLKAESKNAGDTRSLRHNIIYGDPATLAKITDWIRVAHRRG